MALSVSAEVKRTANLAVAISTINRPNDLICCLEGILQGQILPRELIVIDQSTGQETEQALERFHERSCRIRYVHQQKRGLSASRNAGIENSTAPIIAFSDDDCVPDPTWVASLEIAFHTTPNPAAVSGRVLPYGAESPGLYSVSSRESTLPADYTGRTIPWVVGTGGNFAIQRGWLDQVGKYDERLGAGSPGKAAEDADMIFRLLRSGARIRFDPNVLIFHKRQDISRRMSSRWNYSFGIGVFCALWLRRQDLYSAHILATWLYNISCELIGQSIKGQRQEAQQWGQSLRGTWKGFVYGLGVK